jgi:single-stranded-DNA-specific exonuclease
VSQPSPRRVDKTWEIREPDPEQVDALREGLELDTLVATLLVNRGIVDLDEARAFLDPRLAALPDPFSMKGMEAAVTRVLRAIDGGEMICVWGDYDVDGVTSASQVVKFFEAAGLPIEWFVPDRFVDGYGLNGDRLPELRERGVELLITVDCGITSVREVEIARGLGMDVVIIDHHQVPPILPAAAAVLDPIQLDCGFPDKRLAACGVTFMFLVALRSRLRDLGRFQGRGEPDLRRWLDLTAIGTVADMVPLLGVNRVIVHHGLLQMAHTEWPGVRALCRVAGVAPDDVSAGRIGFHLGPRINAAGRVAHASAGIELLTTSDESVAESIAREVDEHNAERRSLQDEVFLAACLQADEHPDPEARRAVVLAGEGWHPGVLGIVASKLVERYHRPTIVMTIEDGVAKGSARSIPGFRLVEHLRVLESHLTKYGGHDHAAGLALPAEGLPAFMAAFEDAARETLEPRHLQPRLRIDTIAPLDLLTRELVQTLARLGPYGMGNPEPSLVALGVPVIEARPVGADQTHLKLTLDGGRYPVDGIAFGMADLQPLPGDRVDVVYIPEINVFRGQERLQIRVKAMRPTA